MKLTNLVARRIIERLLNGEDYRAEVLALINTHFMDYAILFFGKIVEAKLRNKAIDEDWYKRAFVTDPTLKTDDIIIHAGLNKKTINNSYGSASRQKVLEIAPEYYDALYQSIQQLTQDHNEIDLTLTIRLNGVSVELNITESLIVINTLAVKRAQLRGGAWSTMGKQVEKNLMRTLCMLFEVPQAHYRSSAQTEQNREIDFVLINAQGNDVACEVKLMGKGNPESADAVIARDSQLFVADTLSDLNKTQLTQRGTAWVELNSPSRFQQFYNALQALDVPCVTIGGDIAVRLNNVLDAVFIHDDDT